MGKQDDITFWVIIPMTTHPKMLQLRENVAVLNVVFTISK